MKRQAWKISPRDFSLIPLLLACFTAFTPGMAAAACKLQDSVVFIEVTADYGDGQQKPVGSGSGVLIHEKGYVLTAKHILPKDRSSIETLSITGSVGSRHGQKIKLHEAAPLDLATDITLLRFPPALGNDWCYVTIGEPRDLNIGYRIGAWGFPLDQDLTNAEGAIASLDGPNASLQMSAGVVPGMSGGPVVNADTGQLVGITVGGAPPYATINFMMPVHYAKVLLDIPPAHYALHNP